MSKLYELLEGHDHIFIDEEFIDKDDIYDKIDEYRGSYMAEEDDYITFPIYAAVKMAKPKLTTEYIGQILEDDEYDTEDAWGEDLVEENEETLVKINDLMHGMIQQLYTTGKHLFDIKIYPEDDKFEVVEENNA